MMQANFQFVHDIIFFFSVYTEGKNGTYGPAGDLMIWYEILKKKHKNRLV